MSGISVGWFDPAALSPEPDALVRGIEQLLSRDAAKRRHWPMAARSIRWEHRDVGVSYLLVDGALPLHMDPPTEGLESESFLLVLQVENRPALATSPATAGNASIFGGWAPPAVNPTFALGCLELRRGMAVHIDTTDTWHGIIGMPPLELLVEAPDRPRAVIVRVRGYAKHDIGGAVEHAANWIGIDLSASRGS